MHENGRKTGKLVNWLTVWGIIVACIAFNVYTSNQQQKKLYRAQYKAESRRADSLLVEKTRLEQRLRELETITNRRVSVVQQNDAQPRVTVASEL